VITTWAMEPDPSAGARSAGRGGYEELADAGTFDSLLRSLMSWELVTQSGEDREDEWRLSEVAQRRLSALQPVVPRLDERTVYFGHACDDCRQRRPTRLTDGVYRCEACVDRRRMTTTNEVLVDGDARGVARHGQLRGGLWERRLHRRHAGAERAIDGVGDQRTSA